jgi:hypothetical protein
MMAVYVAWVAFCWVLRGGFFGKLMRTYLGWEPGTQLTRGAASGLIALPLLYFTPWALAAWPAVWLAMTLGYFGEAMGQTRQPRDILLMAAWGLTVTAVAVVPLAWQAPLDFAWAAFGLLAGPVYWLNHRIGNDRLLDWTERAEAMTGAAVGAALWSAS